MRILLIEDNAALATLIKMMLEDEGYEIAHLLRGDEALEILKNSKFDIVITDLKLPGVGGSEIIEYVTKNDPDVIVIVITAFGNIEDAVKAIKLGAYDYIPKPFENEVLINVVNKAAKYKSLKTENSNLQNYVKDTIRPQIVGKSQKIKDALSLVDKVADTDAPVLLLGESGTGKELIAREIHFKSRRNNRPFITINCAAIPEQLFESELFGHKRGAFTGADRDKKGKIALSDGGTLFLDEIGELPVENLQAKLLRFLQEKEIQPLGGTGTEKVDVRIIAATNRDLKQMVNENKFREDLYYRLNVFPIYVPPLRERKDDIKDLCEFFLKKYGLKKVSLDPEILNRLVSYDFPGNVRELENIIYRMIILSKNGKLDLSFLDDFCSRDTEGDSQFDLPEDLFDLVKFEKNVIVKAMKKFNGNKTHVARYLNIPRHVLLYRLEKLGIKY
jgi:two-component system NtrC family response regulator